MSTFIPGQLLGKSVIDSHGAVIGVIRGLSQTRCNGAFDEVRIESGTVSVFLPIAHLEPAGEHFLRIDNRANFPSSVTPGKLPLTARMAGMRTRPVRPGKVSSGSLLHPYTVPFPPIKEVFGYVADRAPPKRVMPKAATGARRLLGRRWRKSRAFVTPGAGSAQKPARKASKLAELMLQLKMFSW